MDPELRCHQLVAAGSSGKASVVALRQTALAEVKKSTGGFVGQAPSLRLDSWATKAAQTSDAYLVQLARSAGLKLATFATGIPDAVQI